MEIGSLSCWSPGFYEILKRVKTFLSLHGGEVAKEIVSEVHLAAAWMGQRFRDGKKQRKVFLTRREALIWEGEEEIAEQPIQKPAIMTHSLFLPEWANEYLKYSKDKFVKKTFDEKVFSFKFFFQSEDLHPSDSVEKLTPYIAVMALKKISISRSGGAANKYKKIYLPLGTGVQDFSDYLRKTLFPL